MSGPPTKAGCYWLKIYGSWRPCEVEENWGDGLQVMWLGRDYQTDMTSEELSEAEWGPELPGPDAPLLKVIEELCQENTKLESDNCNAWARVAGLEKTVEAQLNGASLTLRTIVTALGGKPSEETSLVWILKRIEELRK